MVLPSSCRRDFLALPAYVREALQVHFATSYADVFQVAFRLEGSNMTISSSSSSGSSSSEEEVVRRLGKGVGGDEEFPPTQQQREQREQLPLSGMMPSFARKILSRPDRSLSPATSTGSTSQPVAA